jgi:hypothetical protein
MRRCRPSFRRKHWDGLPAGDAQVLPLGEFEQLVQDAITATGEPAFGLLVGSACRSTATACWATRP